MLFLQRSFLKWGRAWSSSFRAPIANAPRGPLFQSGHQHLFCQVMFLTGKQRKKRKNADNLSFWGISGFKAQMEDLRGNGKWIWERIVPVDLKSIKCILSSVRGMMRRKTVWCFYYQEAYSPNNELCGSLLSLSIQSTLAYTYFKNEKLTKDDCGYEIHWQDGNIKRTFLDYWKQFLVLCNHIWPSRLKQLPLDKLV